MSADSAYVNNFKAGFKGRKLELRLPCVVCKTGAMVFDNTSIIMGWPPIIPVVCLSCGEKNVMLVGNKDEKGKQEVSDTS